MENFAQKTISDFTQELYDKVSIPGGGAAAALTGALSASLCAMAANFTTGKKKFAEYENDLHRILDKTDLLRLNLVELMDKDAEGFKPVANAYSMDKNDPNRAEVLEAATKTALKAPLEIVRKISELMDLLTLANTMTSRLLKSDIACSAYLASSALKSASVNVFVNTKNLKDRDFADRVNYEVNEHLKKCAAVEKMADEICTSLRG